MSLGIHPVLAALLRNRSGALIVALQIAIALAIGVNASYIVHQRILMMSQPTGIDDANVFALESVKFTPHFNYDASLRADLVYLRSLPGVVAATATNAAPFAGGGSSRAISSQPRRQGQHAQIDVFTMDEQGVRTLGAHLIAGRDFRPEEILPALAEGGEGKLPPQILLTRAAAGRLFPHQNPLGRTVYQDNQPATIVGVLDDMIGSWCCSTDGAQLEVAIFPERAPPYELGYLVRTQPGRRDEIMRLAQQHLAASNPGRLIKNVHSLQYYKKSLYLSDRATAIFLMTVTSLVLAVACLGIFTLATFSVITRTKQIGTRRAVGARRRDIVRHFLAENALITGAGIVLGCLLALGAGFGLSALYSLPRLDLYYLVGGVLVIFILGQLAAWWPARRAASVPPSVATRTV